MNQFIVLIVACIVAFVAAECPSACSGHGTCGAYDACTCFRNWMSNDCSERICPFGLAHVDTPLGDLDASSGKLTGPGAAVIVNDAVYPSGTTEQFPAMKDTAGDVTTESAHYYRECSNKGICDRSSGECECFDGYDGSSCQRASCPTSSNGVCSGHGTCKTIQELAASDNENIYRLWDEDVTMGCDCDAGYEGADCASRKCKVGVDPLYADDFANVRHANYTVQFYIMNDDAEIYGNYSLIFTDAYGEDWQTEPIDIDANCAVIQDRLESIPNDVIPYGTVKCYKSEENLHVGSNMDTTKTAAGALGALGGQTNDVANDGQKDTESVHTGQSVNEAGLGNAEQVFSAYNYSIVNKYILAFPGNPGVIAPVKINRYLDGKRPTLFSTETVIRDISPQYARDAQTLGVHIYANGFHGETTDYVNDECEGVLVGLASDQVDNGGDANNGEKPTHYLNIEDNLQFERLKRCLGDSDGVKTNNVDVYDWDFGNFMNPHLIKLVDATQDRYTEYIRADGTSYKVLATGDTPIGEGENWETFPMTKLCNRGTPWLNDNYESTRTHELKFQSTSDSTQYNRGTHGWCKDINPPGFFAIIYFDDCSANGLSNLMVSTFVVDATAANTKTQSCSSGRKGFRVLSRVANDYATTTKFHVYTTKGTLQQVSQNSKAYNANYKEMYKNHDGSTTTGRLNPDFIHNLHSPVIHVTNSTFYGANGAVDCETAWDASTNTPKYGNMDCLNKGDKIFLLNLGDRDTAQCEANRAYGNIRGVSVASAHNCYYQPTGKSFDSNPSYLNMYTVKKIGKIAKNPNEADYADKFWKPSAPTTEMNARGGVNAAIHAEAYRHQITLDMGVNTLYMSNAYGDQVSTTDAKTQTGAPFVQISRGPELDATIYKFYPPTLASTGTTGYEYVAPCSNRGICNGDDGICECFEGYTGDSCNSINSLAK